MLCFKKTLLAFYFIFYIAPHVSRNGKQFDMKSRAFFLKSKYFEYLQEQNKVT